MGMREMRDAVIVSTARSANGRANKGGFCDVRPDDLLMSMVSEALSRVPVIDPKEIEDVIVGCGSPAGQQGNNIARVTAVALGLDRVPGTTVNRYCASGVQSIRMAVHAIRSGEGDAFVAAGVESVSAYRYGDADAFPTAANPLFDLAQQETARRAQQNDPWVDPRAHRRLPDVYISMGQTAENVASRFGITRRELDEYAYRSQLRARLAAERGFWKGDIAPFMRSDGEVIDTDESARPMTTLDGLAELKPVFRDDGLLTAGNSCPLNDGAAAAVVMSSERARELGLAPLARVVSTAVSALSPEIMGMGPVEATKRALGRAGLAIADIDQFEINEAFASQVIASARELGIHDDRLNVNGGAIALGHPFGATGVRITSTLIRSLQERDDEFGVVTMCVAGGMGAAMILQRLD